MHGFETDIVGVAERFGVGFKFNHIEHLPATVRPNYYVYIQIREFENIFLHTWWHCNVAIEVAKFTVWVNKSKDVVPAILPEIFKRDRSLVDGAEIVVPYRLFKNADGN